MICRANDFAAIRMTSLLDDYSTLIRCSAHIDVGELRFAGQVG
jgi:hypothetical protein